MYLRVETPDTVTTKSVYTHSVVTPQTCYRSNESHASCGEFDIRLRMKGKRLMYRLVTDINSSGDEKSEQDLITSPKNLVAIIYHRLECINT